MRLAAIVLALLLPAIALGQPGLTPPSSPPVYPAPVAETPEVKNPGTATMLALGGTLAGWGLMAAAERSEGAATAGLLLAIIGPSAGHIYAGEGGHALATSLLRTAALGAFVVGLVSLFSAGDCDFDCTETNSRDVENGELLLWSGAIGFVALTVYDIVDAGSAARRTNAKHARWMFQPSMVQSVNGPSPAVALTGRF